MEMELMFGGRRMQPADYEFLKDATHGLSQRLRSRAGRRTTRVCQQTISKYGNKSNPDFVEKWMGIDIVADLENALRDPVVTRALAELSNCIVVPLPEGAGFAELATAMGESTKEFGEAMVVLGEALADGKISPRERPQINKEIDEAIAKLCALRELVNETEDTE